MKHIYEPAFYARVGLRYQDVISRKKLDLEEMRWSELLQPYVLAELGADDVADNVINTETQSVIRVPDIETGQVKVRHGLVTDIETKEQCYLIDADFSVAGKGGIDDPFRTLDRFNRYAGNLLRWAITDTLHRAMEPVAL